VPMRCPTPKVTAGVETTGDELAHSGAQGGATVEDSDPGADCEQCEHRQPDRRQERRCASLDQIRQHHNEGEQA
jgi:hypothetical protein